MPPTTTDALEVVLAFAGLADVASLAGVPAPWIAVAVAAFFGAGIVKMAKQRHEIDRFRTR